MTRTEYMNDSSSKHHEYYAQFVTESTKAYILRSLTIKDLKEAIKNGDKHFNKIKIPFNNMGSGGDWWWDFAPLNTKLAHEMGEGISKSTHTCVGKAAARILVEESK